MVETQNPKRVWTRENQLNYSLTLFVDLEKRSSRKSRRIDLSVYRPQGTPQKLVSELAIRHSWSGWKQHGTIFLPRITRYAIRFIEKLSSSSINAKIPRISQSVHSPNVDIIYVKWAGVGEVITSAVHIQRDEAKHRKSA